MAKLLKLRRGSTTQHASFTGAEGEVTIDTTKDTAVVHDGAQAGGRPLLREDCDNLPDNAVPATKIGAGALPTDVTVASANIVNGTIVADDLAATGVSAGTVGSATAIPIVTVNNKGQVTSTSTTAIDQTKIENGTSEVEVVQDSSISGKVAGTERLSIKSTGIDVNGKVVVSDKYSLDTHGDLRRKTTATNAVEGGLTGHVLQNSVVLDADQDIWLSSTSGKKITFGTSDSTTHEVMRVQCAAVGASQHGFVNLNYVTANAGGNASSATKLATNSSGITVTGNIAVSGTVDGRDVATDGSKLDGIESNATQDMSATEILNAIKTVDGSGSGLDADSIDGLEAGNLLRSDTADTAQGDITFSGGAGAITVAAASDIRIAGGTWTGEYTGGMKIQHNGTDGYIQYNGNIYHRTGGGDNRLTLDTSGNLTAAGNVTAYSDERLKTDVNTINDALGIVGKLRGVSYKWIATDKPSIGVIAQEVEEVIPEVVLTNRETNPSTGETTEIKSVDYGKIVGVLINAINELKAEVDALKKPKKKGGK